MFIFCMFFFLLSGRCKECRCATNSHLLFFHRKNLARHWMADCFAAVVANEKVIFIARIEPQKNGISVPLTYGEYAEFMFQKRKHGFSEKNNRRHPFR